MKYKLQFWFHPHLLMAYGLILLLLLVLANWLDSATTYSTPVISHASFWEEITAPFTNRTAAAASYGFSGPVGEGIFLLICIFGMLGTGTFLLLVALALLFFVQDLWRERSSKIVRG